MLTLWIVPVGIETCTNKPLRHPEIALNCTCWNWNDGKMYAVLEICGSELYLLELKHFYWVFCSWPFRPLNCTCWNWNQVISILGGQAIGLWIVPVGIETLDVLRIWNKIDSLNCTCWNWNQVTMLESSIAVAALNCTCWNWNRKFTVWKR